TSPPWRAFLRGLEGLRTTIRVNTTHRLSRAEAVHKPFHKLTLGASLAFVAVLLGGCPKSNTDFQTAKKAEAVQDYDTALAYYERALRAEPTNAEFKLRASSMRFEDGQFHIRQGRLAAQKGDLQRALTEFEKAQAIDPSSSIADQEVKRTLQQIAAQNAAEAP